MKQLAFLLGLVISLQAAAQLQPKVSYTVSPATKNNYNTFLVELSVKGNASGQTTFAIPFEKGQFQPQDQISIVDVVNGQKHQYVAADSSLYWVKHKPNAQLTLKYVVKNALKDSVPKMENFFAQMLTSVYYHIIGNTFWVAPNDSSNSVYNISLNWKGFPAHWSHLNSYGANKTSQLIKANLNDFLNAIYLGGDFRVHQAKVKGAPVYLGIRGQWQFTDTQLLQLVEQTITAQRTYWDDKAADPFVVSLIPMKYYNEHETSITGRGLTNTFISTATNSKAFGLNDVFFLYNHEFMHYWLGQVVKQTPPYNDLKWFHEGFTDYFAHVIMLDKGLFNEQEFKQRINTIFAAYYSDSTHQWPNGSVQTDGSPFLEIQQLPYKRGLLFALYLDESIKKQTTGKASLKTIMQAIFKEARKSGRTFSNEWLLAVLQQTTGHDYKPVLDEFITQGRFISLAHWQKVTDKIELAPAETFDLGFTTETGKLALNVAIATVQEGSNVQLAGLKVGDKIVGGGYQRDPSQLSSLSVLRGTEKIKVEFYASKKIWTPQLK